MLTTPVRLLVIFWVSLATFSFAQNLPSEMRLSADGHRLVTGGRETEGFYDESVVRTINLQFPQTNYWQLMTSNYQSKTNILATMTVDGEVIDSVGVRFKGQTSYSQNQTQKKSFSVDLDFVRDGQDAMGYESLNFNNCFLDPTYLREMLYLHLSRKHLPSAKANYIKLSLNGQDWGLYGNVQNLDGEYLKEWFLSNKGTRWRAERTGGFTPGMGGGGGFGAGKSSLNYLGTDTALYVPNYTLKKTYKPNPWDDLRDVCDKLGNTPAAVLEDTLKKYLDLDRTLWFLAHEILFTDDDSYVFKGGMDYFLYWDEATHRMTPLEYDGNTCIDLTKASSWSPFYRETDTKYALMNKLFPVPGIRQRYLAHVRTLIADSFDPIRNDSLIDAYYTKINDLVQADPKKVYTYNQFLTEKNNLKNFFRTRRTYLMNNAEVNRVAPVISQVWFSADNQPFTAPEPQQTVQVSAKAVGTPGIKTMRLYYANGLDGAFERLSMFDDGAHGDGAAADGVFGASLPAYAAGTWVRFYLEAVSSDLAATVGYEPKGAEHDVYVYRVTGASGNNTEVVINEFMAANAKTAADPNGEYDDWIELYNNSDQPQKLGGWFLSDDSAKPAKWKFPADVTLPGKSYLVVWADENGTQNGLHANFKLSANGETVILAKPDSSIVQEIVFGPQQDDQGYARMPNGTGPFVAQGPTFNANNETVDSHEPIAPLLQLQVYPNPSNGTFTIAIDGPSSIPTVVFNLQGIPVWTGDVNRQAIVDLAGRPSGIYLVKAGSETRKVVLR